jgi:hypothetical protein
LRVHVLLRQQPSDAGLDVTQPDTSIGSDGSGSGVDSSGTDAIPTDGGDATSADAADAAHGPWQYSVVAGNGSQGFSGDNEPATSAQLGPYLSGMGKDGQGNLYIAVAVYKID